MMRKYPIPVARKIAVFGVAIVTLIASLPTMVDYTIVGEKLLFYLEGIAAWTEKKSLLLLIPSLLHLLGIEVSDAYRFNVVIVNLATAYIAYLGFEKCFRSREIGMVGCVLYTLMPARISIVYHRADVAVYTLLIFLPLLVWGIGCLYRLFRKKPLRNGKNAWEVLPEEWKVLVLAVTLAFLVHGVYQVNDILMTGRDFIRSYQP